MNKLKTLGLWLDGFNWLAIFAVILFIAAVVTGVTLPAYVGLVLAFGLGSVAAAILAR